MRRASVKGDDRGGVRGHDGQDGRVAAVEVEEVWRMVGGETAEASGLAFAEGDRIGEDGFGRDGDGRGGRTERRGDRELERAGGAADAVRAGDRDDGAGAAVGDAAGDDGPGDFGGEVPVARLEVLRLWAVRAAVPDLAAVNALAPGERVFDPEGEVRAARDGEDLARDGRRHAAAGLGDGPLVALRQNHLGIARGEGGERE